MHEDTIQNHPKKRIYLALAGGGAKGIVHAGAYAHVSRKYDIVGVSGTSAGAIVAALIAAGFTADELFHESPDGKGVSPVFEKIKEKHKDVKVLSDLLGKKNFASLRRMKSTASVVFEILARRRKLSLLIVSILVFAVWKVPLGAVDNISDNWWVEAVFFLITLALRIAVTFVLVMSHVFLSVTKVTKNGIASTSRAIEAVCNIIAEKIGVAGGQEVYLDCLPMPLMIIATDVKGKKARVFRSGVDRVKLCDALSASICIPIVFPPHVIDGAEYFDGGIVSNLPLYVFAEQGKLFPERKIIGFGITEGDEELSSPSRFKIVRWAHSRTGQMRKGLENLLFPVDEVQFYMGSIFGTFFTGTQELAHIGSNTIPINIKTKLKTTQFDVTPSQALLAYRQGVIHAISVDNEFEIDDYARDFCKILFELVSMNMRLPLGAIPRCEERIRIALAFKKPHNFSTLSLRYGYGFEISPDMNIDLPIDSSSCGEAWLSLKPVFENNQINIFQRLSSYEHILGRISPNIKWVICVPIVEDGKSEPEFVVNIDGNWALESRLVDEAGIEIAQEVAIFEIARKVTLRGRDLATVIRDHRESAKS
ncbi:Patatin-like phospholipase [Paracoccus aminovorans]|uniref:Patatin-like phospholipase n=1 Tax=Paracoccus aminovorans TaxID=34004 RepID=A0A1I3DZR0_9RHOB|nr:patatin-like phospholipase family protein [Paracoccus aminovorans]CQR84268.1 hypothetical protein JCM7685_pAMV3p0323 [Paracoccus aminovorans]SFH91941.1 Patatin-like phospholipase [Paracoccus aminovorans]